ncbi:MAG: insulinase family protein [Alphaproteobacteria bacterium]|nr:insulinase family protein [Alphaproteobacteria bacterium]
MTHARTLGLLAAAASLALASCSTTAGGAAAALPAGVSDASGSPPPAQAAAADPVVSELAAMKLDIPYTKYVLKNGLTLIVAPDTKTPTVTFHIWYHVGSKDEPKGRSGFAHLFEHLMFNGSEHFNDDFFKATQKVGATNQNGSTTTDRTNYFQTVPKEALDTILWLESDRMGYLLGAVDQHRLDEQRGVVQNEKRQGENQPYGLVNNHITAAIYPDDHPYGHTVIGSMDDLNAAKLDDVRDWFKTWYGPANAVLVLAGDITPEEGKAAVEKYFGEIPPGPPPSHPKAWVAKRTGAQRETMYDRVAAPRIYKVWNVPELGDPDGELLDVAAYALAGDKNARLTKRLVHDEQVATNVSAFNSQSEIAGQFRVVVTAKPGADLGHIEAVVQEEMDKLMASGPTQDELDKMKVQTVSGIVQEMERTSSKAGLLATWETYLGNAGAWKDSLKRTEAAQPATVAAAARKWLSDGSYTLTVQPFENFAATRTGVDRKTMPLPGNIADTTFPKYQTATLSNGMKVMLAERHDAPTVTVRMAVDTGTPADWASIPEATGNLSVGLMDEGTTSRSALEIADQLDRLGATLSVGGGGETSNVQVTALTPTLDQALDIFADVIRNPAYGEADFRRVQQQQEESIRQAMRNPNYMATYVMAKELWGADHPYGRVATPDDIAKISREDVIAFHKRWFGPNNAVIVVVGDTTLTEMTPKLEAAFKGWAPAPGKRADVAPGVRPSRSKVFLVDRPGSVQSVILVGGVEAPRDPAEDQKLSAFNALFGGNFTSRINMNLREDKHWSYGARTGISGGLGPRDFVVTAPVQTDATKGALIELRKELKDVVGARPPSGDEVEAAKTNAILGLSSRWESNAAVANSLAEMAIFDLPSDYFDTYAAGYRKVTTADAEAMAKKLIPNQNHVWVIVGDRSKIEAGVRELNLGDLTILDSDGNPAS